MDPSAPSQPPLDEAYEQPSNPSTKNPDEISSGTSTSTSYQRSDPSIDSRSPGDLRDSLSGQEGGQGGEGGYKSNTGSLGYGAVGEEAKRGDQEARYGAPVSNTEGEQMRAAGDGDIAKAQERKTGFGEQADLVGGLDRKMEEQRGVKERRYGDADGGGDSGGGVDVQGVLGGKVAGGGGSGASGGEKVDERDLQ